MTPGSIALIDLFEAHMRLERGLSANTLEAYSRDASKLLDFIDDRGIAPADVTLDTLRAFASGLHDIGIGAASQARIVSGIKAFFRFMTAESRISADPSELLEAPSTSRHLPDTLSVVAEIDAMEASIDMSKPEGQRNRAIIETLYSCGLRVSELVDLEINRIFIPEGFLIVVGKGNKERLVPLSPLGHKRDTEVARRPRPHDRHTPGRRRHTLSQPPRREADPRHGVLHHTPGGSQGRNTQENIAPHTAPLILRRICSKGAPI